MEGYVVFKIDGVERRMFFGNYALEKTLDHFGVSVSDIGTLLNTKLLPLIRMFLYYGAEDQLWKEEKREPDFTPRDIHDWIDQSGGSSGELVIKVSKELFRCLGLTNSEPEKKEQKKSKQAKS